MNSYPEITQALLAFGETLPAEDLFPTVIPEASDFIYSNPYAFAIAVCLDRGTKIEIIWTLPYDIYKALGHLDPEQINKMELDELADLFERLPRKPRYVNAAPRTIQELTRIVMEENDGKAENIWLGKRSGDVKRTFNSIYGVGPGIANMSVLLIESAFGIRFDDLDRRRMDIKPDVHTKRVLYRLGIIEEEDFDLAIQATRMMNPKYPGALDGALWSIGRQWCFASDPDCLRCPLKRLCPKIKARW